MLWCVSAHANVSSDVENCGPCELGPGAATMPGSQDRVNGVNGVIEAPHDILNVPVPHSRFSLSVEDTLWI